MSSLQFRVLRVTANGNLLLEPVKHKEPIAKKTKLLLNGKKAAEIFDTIAEVNSPLYLAKLLVSQNLTGEILEGVNKK
ncbi:MAG: hypothetical protein V1722_01340 [Candidatus Micrarchaeota archaeon]